MTDWVGGGEVEAVARRYQVDGEVGRFSFTTHRGVDARDGQEWASAGQCFPALTGREWYQTSGFKELAFGYGSPLSVRGGTMNPRLQPPYIPLHRMPVNLGPLWRRLLIRPFSEDLHRLTSLMMRAFQGLFSVKTSRTSALFRGGYSRLVAALSDPLQVGVRVFRPLLPPPSSPFLTGGLPRERNEWGFPS